MKSIVMNTQSILDFLKEGNLTLVKSFHDQPYEPGDVVYIREPWFRLKGEQECFVYSADIQDSSIYKWSSPVSMPEAAVRYYGRITGILSDNVGQWEIKIQAISKEEAEAAEAGIPFSPAATPVETETHSEITDLSDAPQEMKDQILENAATLSEQKSEIMLSNEEAGSFTVGTCAYCAREWGVTLEGSPDGGYPTQRTANAAATRACNCEEAEASRTKSLSVTLAVTTGICLYCGQLIEVGPHMLQKDANKTATDVCSCPEAKTERTVTEQIEDARDRVERLFGDSSEELGFKPIADNAPVSMLNDIVALIARRLISSATVQIRGQCKAKIGLTSKGKIKVSRSETRSYDLEAGE